MKRLVIAVILLLSFSHLFAQRGRTGIGNNQPAQAPVLPPPLATRDVSGIIKDTKGQTIIGATIILSSKTDTLYGASNDDGIFIFKNVKQSTFVISVKSVSYQQFVQRYKMSDVARHITLNDIVLKEDNKTLKEVEINGTPSVVYKPDTVEYKASDYHVRENSTIDELLKKMEGFEVGSDGSVTHQGQTITKAKLNGKEYAGGNIAQAIQNLPADIVDKIQVVDDYGDMAERTGIKDGDPDKVLNITTRDDRSVGTTGRLIGQAGNDDRYNGQLFIQRINANQQIGLIGNIRNTVTGVASTGVQGGATNGGGGGGGVGGNARNNTGGSPGTLQSGAPTFNYRDQWSKKVQVISSYAYSFTNSNSINKSYGQRYTSYGPDNFTNDNTNQRNAHTHTLHLEMDFDFNKANYLQVTPTFSYSYTSSGTTLSQDDIEDYTTGFVHQFQTGTSASSSTTTNYGVTALYVHVFKKPKRNLSLQASISQNNQQTTGATDKDYKYFKDSTQNVLIKDSLANLLTPRTNKTLNLRTTITYTEPLGKYSRVEFRGDMTRNKNNSVSIQDSVLANGQIKDLTQLDNIYNYTTTQSHINFNYHYKTDKTDLTLGVAAIPYNLSGTKVDENVNQDVETSHSYFRVIPAFRYAYQWSKTERLTLTYSGSNSDPSFQEIQPFTDRSDPKNLKVGNPNLQPAFTNSISGAYNNYIANEKANISFNVNYTMLDNTITTNTVQLREPLTVDPLNPANNTFQNINVVNYINLGGSKSFVARYNLSKQSNDRRLNFALNGNVTWNYRPGESNNLLYHQTEWRFDERFGPRFNYSGDSEVNPYIGYDLDRNFTTLLGAKPTFYQTVQLAIDGKQYFGDTYQINYSARKVFVSGVAGSTNPLVINAGFQKEFLQHKNLVVTFDVYDLLHQNNFIQQTVSPTGVTNTVSNTLSRYFMLGFRLNLQKWSGRPMRNGKPMQRRGDGSFIYN